MPPPLKATEYWPDFTDGTLVRNAARCNHLQGIQAKHQSVNPPGPSRPPARNPRALDKVPRNNQPAPEVQGVTQAKQEEADALRLSHLPTGSTRALAPNNPPGPGVQVVTQTEHRPVNLPGSSCPPVEFSPVLAPSNVPQQLVTIRPKISL